MLVLCKAIMLSSLQGGFTMRDSKISDDEVIERYLSGERLKGLVTATGVTRTAIYDLFKRRAIEPYKRRILALKCKFCSEEFARPRSHVKGEHSGYCSIQCFHADRSIAGEYSKIGGVISRVKDSLDYAEEVNRRKFGKLAHKAVVDAGIVLKTGEVVHHKDGKRQNFTPDNLQVFKNQSEHMKYHHSLRKKNI